MQAVERQLGRSRPGATAVFRHANRRASGGRPETGAERPEQHVLIEIVDGTHLGERPCMGIAGGTNVDVRVIPVPRASAIGRTYRYDLSPRRVPEYIVVVDEIRVGV